MLNIFFLPSPLSQGYKVDRGGDNKSNNSANASLIRRFNQHSTMVLQAGRRASSTVTAGESQTNGSATPNSSSSNNRHTASHEAEPPTKKVKCLWNYLFTGM